MAVTLSISDEKAAPVGQENYVHRIMQRFSERPSDVAVYFREQRLSGADVAASVTSVTSGLQRCGLGPGGTVAVLTASNHPAMLVVRYAAHLLGASVVNLRSANPRSDAVALSADIQTRVIGATGASVLVSDAEHMERAQELQVRSGGELRLVGYEFGTAQIPDVLTGTPESSGEIAESGGFPGLPEYVPARRAVVGFTSGSTGDPKGISQSFEVWNSIVGSFPGMADPDIKPVFLAVTPLSHTIGPMADSVLAAGGSVVLLQDFDAPEVLRTIEERRVTDTYLAVPHLYRLTDELQTAGTDLSSLRRVVYSGTPAAPHRIAEAHKAFGDVITQLYGTSEAGGISSLTSEDHYEPELLPTVGRPFPWVRLRFVDPETGRNVPEGEVGEICVQAPTVMTCYLSDETAPEVAIPNSRRWLRTGDLGHLDEYGYLRLTGRSGNVIKSGGLKIHPESVERALLAYPGVREAVVFGTQDANRVEYVHAAVVAEPHCTGEQLQSHVGEVLTPLHAPVSITFWDSLPLDERGKPDKAYLRSATPQEMRPSPPWKGTP